ncbi:DUF6053 domain-containing protein [Lysobacter enzymogenes]|uniref:DUF6053 domain-containing protein n=1 Tax=Lysobacter enzymogenes TaxID=69 RepID=UPI003CCC9281
MLDECANPGSGRDSCVWAPRNRAAKLRRRVPYAAVYRSGSAPPVGWAAPPIVSPICCGRASAPTLSAQVASKDRRGGTKSIGPEGPPTRLMWEGLQPRRFRLRSLETSPQRSEEHRA